MCPVNEVLAHGPIYWLEGELKVFFILDQFIEKNLFFFKIKAWWDVRSNCDQSI